MEDRCWGGVGTFKRMRLYVGNLSYKVTSADLREFFQQIGEVREAHVLSDSVTGASRGFGFVEMENRVAAERAIRELNGADVVGRPLVVTAAHTDSGKAIKLPES